MRVEISGHYTQGGFENKINEIGVKNITELNIYVCDCKKFMNSSSGYLNLSRFNNFSLSIDNLLSNNNSSISFIEKLQELDCCHFSNISKIPYLPNLKKLICSFTDISSIPPMEKLEELNCCECPKLSEISNLPKLEKLHCSISLKIKVYNKNLKINYCKDMFQHFQGRLFQNTYRNYELLIF